MDLSEMLKRSLSLAAVALAAGVSLLSTTPAAAAIDFRPCNGRPELQCGAVNVPLDRTGQLPGTVSLHVERIPTPGQRRGMLVFLAGGPGQAASSIPAEFYKLLQKAAPGYDLVTFDQRGTGKSGELQCPNLERAALSTETDESATRRVGALVAKCAETLGQRRYFYTTQDSVDDLDALRNALEAERIALSGVSYGTFVAGSYARRYPNRVERLVLDSVVAPEGVDAFDLSSFGAVGRVLRALCSSGACRGVTSRPIYDLSRLTNKTAAKPLRGFYTDASGHRKRAALGGPDDPESLFDLLVEGDLNPALRALFPGAVRSALGGDTAQLLRMKNAVSSGGGEPAGISVALTVATICAEARFPWLRTTPLTDRSATIEGTANAFAPQQLVPFNQTTAKKTAELELCLQWPDSPFAAAPQGTFPDVPALILNGEADLRTPLEDASRIAALLPQSTLLAVPNNGHSALGSQDCALKALTRFMTGQTVGNPCSGSKPLLPVQPIAPTKLSYLPTAKGISGRRGRTVTAVRRTISDIGVGLILAAGASDATKLRFGGLRGGHGSAVLTLKGGIGLKVTFERYSYVPGMWLSGEIKIAIAGNERVKLSGDLRVGGKSTSRGRLALDAGRNLTGTLDGKRVRFHIPTVASTKKRAQAAALPGSLPHRPNSALLLAARQL